VKRPDGRVMEWAAVERPYSGEPRAVRRGCRNDEPPGAHDPHRARRGVTSARGLQFEAIAAR